RRTTGYCLLTGFRALPLKPPLLLKSLSPKVLTTPPMAKKLEVFPVTVDCASQTVAPAPSASTPIELPAACDVVTKTLLAAGPADVDAAKPCRLLAATLSVTAAVNAPVPLLPCRNTPAPLLLPSNTVWSMLAVMAPAPCVASRIAVPPLLLKCELV